MIKKIISRISLIIMGRKPFNTIFSFNYHNISHIVKFLRESKLHLKHKNNILLDVGAGASPYYDLFKDAISKYIVVDLEIVLPKEEKRNIIQKVGTAESLPIESNSIDIVLSNQVLEHVLDERLAVKESYRVLKEGGLFIGSVPHISPIHLEPYDFRRFTNYGLQKILKDNGFEIIEIEGNGGIHRATAFSLLMDWNLSFHHEGKSQKFNTLKHLLLFPINGFMNILAILGDFILGDKRRSPSNYCWIARKVE